MPTFSARDWIFSSIKVAKPSDNHSSLQSFAPTSRPNHACEISCARRTRILASPERTDCERNTRLGLQEEVKKQCWGKKILDFRTNLSNSVTNFEVILKKKKKIVKLLTSLRNRHSLTSQYVLAFNWRILARYNNFRVIRNLIWENVGRKFTPKSLAFELGHEDTKVKFYQRVDEGRMTKVNRVKAWYFKPWRGWLSKAQLSGNSTFIIWTQFLKWCFPADESLSRGQEANPLRHPLSTYLI